MIGSSMCVAAAIVLASGLFLLQECQFLIPYRHLLFAKYGTTISLFAAVLLINIFAVVYWLSRIIFLKDTGKKLAHLEKQLRTGKSLSDELHQRLEE